ncbi:hypothetical protein ACLB2K_070580 [Fragaria x ananassa]
MPKNKGKGGKNRKMGTNKAEDEKRELLFKVDGTEYGQVTRMLGNSRLDVKCHDGVTRLCNIAASPPQHRWQVTEEDYQDGKASVIHRYMPDETRLLKANGKLNDNFRPNEGDDDDEDNNGDDNIEFEDADVPHHTVPVQALFQTASVVVDQIIEKTPTRMKADWIRIGKISI